MENSHKEYNTGSSEMQVPFRIDPEFENKIPEMPKEDFEGLKADIIADGYVRDPLVVWKEENTLVDGHNRWKIIQENYKLLHAWNFDPDSMCAQIINAMAMFYKTYGGNFKRIDLVNSLKRITPMQIIREGRTLRMKNGFAREIVKCYNTKRRYKLDIDKL